MGEFWGEVTEFWEMYSDQVMLGLGFVALGLVVASLVLFFKAKDKAKWISAFAAIVVMAWTSEALLDVALHTWKLPAGFAGVAFFVFEALLLSTLMEAERERAETGMPGAAAGYAFVIAVVQGGVAALGTDIFSLQVLRVTLPILAIGRWWLTLRRPRTTDTEEMKQRRKQREEERESTWVITPTTILTALRIKRPGKLTASDAERERVIARMAVLADAATTSPRWWRPWVEYRLRRLARGATQSMVEKAAEQANRASRAVEVMVPGGRAGAGNSGTARLSNRAASDRAVPGSAGRRVVPDRAVPDAGQESMPDAAQRPVPGTVVPGSGPEVSDRRAVHEVDAGQQRTPRPRVTTELPAETVERSGADEAAIREEARQMYRASVAAGRSLSGAELARMYHRPDPSWGSRRVREVRRQDEQAAAGEPASAESEQQ